MCEAWQALQYRCGSRSLGLKQLEQVVFMGRIVPRIQKGFKHYPMCEIGHKPLPLRSRPFFWPAVLKEFGMYVKEFAASLEPGRAPRAPGRADREPRGLVDDRRPTHLEHRIADPGGQIAPPGSRTTRPGSRIADQRNAHSTPRSTYETRHARTWSSRRKRPGSRITDHIHRATYPGRSIKAPEPGSARTRAAWTAQGKRSTREPRAIAQARAIGYHLDGSPSSETAQGAPGKIPPGKKRGLRRALS